jgi:uncharacterized DUF497 family protein
VHRIECEELFGERRSAPRRSRALRDRAAPLALGRTRLGRKLFVVFTIREQKLRLISARDMSRKERRIHDQALDEGD